MLPDKDGNEMLTVEEYNESDNDLHSLSVEAANLMIGDDIYMHVSYLCADECVTFGLKQGGKIPKVTIRVEFVDESEAIGEDVSLLGAP